MFNLRFQKNGQIVKLGDYPKSFVAASDRNPKFGLNYKKPKKLKQIVGKTRSDNPMTVPFKDRLRYLQVKSDVGPYVKARTLRKMRADYEKKKKDLLNLSEHNCYVCSGRPDHRHHVVPLRRGGTNSRANLVPLCNVCHEQVHPWLNKSSDMTAGIIPVNATDSGRAWNPQLPCYSLIQGLPPSAAIVK